MILKKKNYYKPLYKQLIKLRDNVQKKNEKKLLSKFKKKKWKIFLIHVKKKIKQIKNRKFNQIYYPNKYKIYDQIQYSVSKYSNKGTSYKKLYKNTLINSKKFRLFYGNLSKKYLKQQLRILLKKKKIENYILSFLETFETRLDTVLYKSKFSLSIRNAQQLILHKKVFVNKRLVQTPSYNLKNGDLISINTKYYLLIEKNLRNVQIWPIPPKHLIINYKTMEIIICNTKNLNPSTNFPFYLNIEQIITNYYRH